MESCLSLNETLACSLSASMSLSLSLPLPLSLPFSCSAYLPRPPLPSQACIAFHKGQYAQARELYASVIQENPGCPAAVRVGLGMCLYKLGHIEPAKKAFIRALQLDVSTA